MSTPAPSRPLARCASLVILLAASCASPDSEPRPRPADMPPNFVLIFVDDVGYGDLGCYGSSTIRTPRMDALAASGLRFTSYYSASPICSPSRAALLTGCYPPRVGVTAVYFPDHVRGLHPDERTVAELLKERGYATACIGKWHLGHLEEFLPTRQGFDESFGIPYSNDMDPVEGSDRDRDRCWRENDFTPWNVPLMEGERIVERPAVQTTLTRRYTTRACEFIREHRDEPFFLYLPHTMPHIPLFVSPEKYDPDPQQAYRLTLEELDDSVGEIVDTLERHRLRESTLVLVISDNGPWLQMRHHGGSAGPLRSGKFETWEGGVRVPAIASWPGTIEAGRESSALVGSIDVLPTLAALAGAPLPADRVIDGRDLGAVLRGDDAATADRTLYFYKGQQLEALRHGPWKLRWKGKGEERRAELFDVVHDLGESHDVALLHADRVARLARRGEDFDAALRARARPEGRREPD